MFDNAIFTYLGILKEYIVTEIALIYATHILAHYSNVFSTQLSTIT